MLNKLKTLYKEQDGQGLVEYSLIISLVILGVIAAVQTFGETLSMFYQNEILNKWP